MSNKTKRLSGCRNLGVVTRCECLGTGGGYKSGYSLKGSLPSIRGMALTSGFARIGKGHPQDDAVEE